MKNQKIIINEQHSLMENQKNLLSDRFETVKIPATGLDVAGIKKLAIELIASGDDIVIVSPIPLLLKLLKGNFKIFHNDKRNKKELPNGKIIFVPSVEGWELL